MVTSLENRITKQIQIRAEAVNVHFALISLGKAFFYCPIDRYLTKNYLVAVIAQ